MERLEVRVVRQRRRERDADGLGTDRPAVARGIGRWVVAHRHVVKALPDIVPEPRLGLGRRDEAVLVEPLLEPSFVGRGQHERGEAPDRLGLDDGHAARCCPGRLAGPCRGRTVGRVLSHVKRKQALEPAERVLRHLRDLGPARRGHDEAERRAVAPEGDLPDQVLLPVLRVVDEEDLLRRERGRVRSVGAPEEGAARVGAVGGEPGREQGDGERQGHGARRHGREGYHPRLAPRRRAASDVAGGHWTPV